MKRLQSASGLAVMLLLTGCAVALPPASSRGIVTGRLMIEGGPIRPDERQQGMRPLPGTVRFTGARHQLITARASGSGAFSIRLPPGTYHVSGRSPRITEVSNGTIREAPCSQPRTVTVAAQHTTRITLTCIVP